MRIEKPDWRAPFGIKVADSMLPIILNGWFQSKVEPINKMLAEGVAVNAFKITETMTDSEKQSVGMWTCGEWDDGRDTHKALLINIKPIKKETAEDVLRDIVGLLDPGCNLEGSKEYRIKQWKRAKAVLEEES